MNRGDILINVMKKEYDTNVYHFAVDTSSEIDLLPKVNTCGKGMLNTIRSCAIGSRAIVTETSDRYILNGEQNKWIKISSSSGGGGEDYDFATKEDIDNIF